MKFYETTYEEYLQALNKTNFHPELEEMFKKFPENLQSLPNIVFYGPSGSGKYTQALKLIKQYSPSGLSLPQGKRINAQTDKYNYSYHISDIHYEIDMAQLGCNSKLIWHDVIQQIVDIVTVKPDTNKTAIVLCKNFHMIHTELLEIFYSYIQEYNSKFSIVHFKFFIITEHLCFIPNNIISSSTIINVKRIIPPTGSATGTTATVPLNFKPGTKMTNVSKFNITPDSILNLKEYYYLNKLNSLDEIPTDIFNTVCDEILVQLYAFNPNAKLESKATVFRDAIYDIFVYNLDPIECVWHIISCLIENGSLKGDAVSDVMTRSYNFLKYFNNNYRPIYHLEAIFYYTLLKIHGIHELDPST